MKWVKLMIVGLFFAVAAETMALDIDVQKDATIKDTNTTILGINHIGLSVTDLEQALAFYQRATGFELLRREKISADQNADRLFAVPGLEMDIAVLRAPNMVFELIEFKHHAGQTRSKMPPQGPGITHTCFQSLASASGYDKFIGVGAERLSRGSQPVKLGDYGVSYAYAYDPDGNMIELEQLEGKILQRSGLDGALRDLDVSMWMSQVGITTPNFEALIDFYRKVLGISPFRVAELNNHPRADDIANVDNLDIVGGWFKMNSRSKVIEIWQYNHPATEVFTGERSPSSLGYTFSLEVGDIQKEHQRLRDAGVEFFSEPIHFGEFWQAYARDIDGNVFALRQVVDQHSSLSIRQFNEL